MYRLGGWQAGVAVGISLAATFSACGTGNHSESVSSITRSAELTHADERKTVSRAGPVTQSSEDQLPPGAVGKALRRIRSENPSRQIPK
jgi:hypothetical protein